MKWRTRPAVRALTRGIGLFLELVKFEHTIFALPFAYMGALLAAHGHVEWRQWVWITAAMVGARTAGMALNRLVDRHIDARNPRTQQRTLPRGAMQPTAVGGLIVGSLGLLVVAAWQLAPLCLWLCPLAVALLVAYSYLKRYTRYAHLGVGLVLACAPVGAWIAVRGTLDPPILLLGGAVMLWVAGFDILYACQDLEFDRESGLHSIPQALGTSGALKAAKICHLGTFLLLATLGVVLSLGFAYYAGLLTVAALLVYEHTLVKPHDMSRVNEAFFTVNGWISVTLFLATWLQYR